MAVFQLGPVIKNRREELGLTQEDLADGICSVPTLSRIENGERMPTRNHFDMLLQRLGYSEMYVDFFTDRHDFQIHELRTKTRRAYITGDYTLAEKHFREFESLVRDKTQIDQQFLMLYQILLHEEDYTNDEKLTLYEAALRLTCPGYNCNHIPRVTSYDEIILLNNIAICYYLAENHDRAISILMSLKLYYDRNVVSSQEALRTQPMILYNLSKCLGQAQRYDECIAICDAGVHLARTTGRCRALCLTLYNRCWALLNRAQPGDREAAQFSLNQAYQFACVMEYEDEAQYCKKLWDESFPDIKLI